MEKDWQNTLRNKVRHNIMEKRIQMKRRSLVLCVTHHDQLSREAMIAIQKASHNKKNESAIDKQAHHSQMAGSRPDSSNRGSHCKPSPEEVKPTHSEGSANELTRRGPTHCSSRHHDHLGQCTWLSSIWNANVFHCPLNVCHTVGFSAGTQVRAAYRLANPWILDEATVTTSVVIDKLDRNRFT